MVMNREKAIAALQELPQEFNLEELMEKLIFAEKVKQLDENKTVSHENVKDMIKKW
jgi:hypothetical protein